MTLDEFKAKINALLNFEAGDTGWGDTLDNMLSAVRDWGERLWNEKAPLDHDHGEAGAVAIAFGTPAELSGLAPTGRLVFGVDNGDFWYYPGGDPFDPSLWQVIHYNTDGVVLPEPYQPDLQEPAEDDPASGKILFPGDRDAWVWNEVTLTRSGVHHRLKPKLKSNGTETDNANICLVYVPEGDYPIVKTRWDDSWTYSAGDLIIPTIGNINGYYYECTTAGTSDSSEPTWGTTPGGTTNDGTAVWTCRAGGAKVLSHLEAGTGTAYESIEIDSSDLQIPSTEVSAGDLVHVAIVRRGGSDDNDDGWVLDKSRLAPVEVA